MMYPLSLSLSLYKKGYVIDNRMYRILSILFRNADWFPRCAKFVIICHYLILSKWQFYLLYFM